jgi:hypothetical protein
MVQRSARERARDGFFGGELEIIELEGSEKRS